MHTYLVRHSLKAWCGQERNSLIVLDAVQSLPQFYDYIFKFVMVDFETKLRLMYVCVCSYMLVQGRTHAQVVVIHFETKLYCVYVHMCIGMYVNPSAEEMEVCVFVCVCACVLHM
jgi:hypothetical protein